MGRRKGEFVTPKAELIPLAQELYNAGLTMVAISRLLGYAERHIREYLVSTKKRTPADVDAIVLRTIDPALMARAHVVRMRSDAYRAQRAPLVLMDALHTNVSNIVKARRGPSCVETPEDKEAA